MVKKLLVCILSLFIFASTATAVYATPVIDVLTNGGNGKFNPGSVFVVSGRVTDAGAPLPDSNVIISVNESTGKQIFYSVTKSNADGYYRSIFTLPSDLAAGVSTVKVTSGQATATTTFSSPGGASALTLLGTYPKGSVNGEPVDVAPVDTGSFALVFDANVNFFTNKNYTNFTIGQNNNNVDSISLYKGDGSAPVSARVNLIQNDSQNGSFTYYDTSGGSQTTERKRVIVISPDEGLSPNTVYRVKVSGELCANNGSKLGQDVTVSFKTGEAVAILSNIATLTSGSYAVSAGGTANETIGGVPTATTKAAFLANLSKGQANQVWNTDGIHDPVVSGDQLVVTAQDGKTQVTYTVTVDTVPPVNPVPSGPIGGGGIIEVPSLPQAVPAEEVGSITQEDDKATLEVDTTKAADLLKDTGKSALVIDVSQITIKAGSEKAVKLPAEVVSLAISEHKPIAIQDGGLTMIIPPEALVKGKEMTFSSAQISGEQVTASPSETKQKAVYTFHASSEGEPIHQFQKEIILTLPIPDGTTDQEKLGVYYLNETAGQWEYVGGRIIDGKLVFKTNHFSTYMVAESEKTFADIASHWAKKDIEVMVARHIVGGVDDDVFAPDNNITRAEFAALLSRVLKLGDAAGDSVFQDITGNEWYANEVKKAAKAGIIEGADGKFRPGDRISRQEMAVMIHRAYRYAGGKIDALKETAFTDKGSISAWAGEAVKSVYTLGIVSGRPDGSFAPLDYATRAEGAVMLKALMDKVGL